MESSVVVDLGKPVKILMTVRKPDDSDLGNS